MAIVGLRELYNYALEPHKPQLCAAGDDLFQALPNGLIYRRIRDQSRNGWELVDDNPRNGELVTGCGGKLFLMHTSGDARI